MCTTNWWNRSCIPYYQNFVSHHQCTWIIDCLPKLVIEPDKHRANRLVIRRVPSTHDQKIIPSFHTSLCISIWYLALTVSNWKTVRLLFPADRTPTVSTDQRTEPPCDFLIMYVGVKMQRSLIKDPPGFHDRTPFLYAFVVIKRVV